MSKILLLSDVHLGMGFPNSKEKWINVAKEYFEKFFFPLIEKELTKDDIIVQLGDLFDNRSIIPIDVLNYAQSILERMSKICPVHIILGNHDLYSKSTSELNSIRLFNYIPNVTVYEKATKIYYNNKSILMMPYIENKAEQIKLLKEHSGCDYLLCHSDLNGAKMHLNSAAHKNVDKIDVECFDGYQIVRSAHIHIRQNNKNFTFVGSIFEMDRNDTDNQKGVYILDTNNMTEKFIPNNISPKFKKIYINTEEDLSQLDNIGNNWIDLFISNTLLINNSKLRRKLESILRDINFESVNYIDDIVTEEKIIVESNEEINESIMSLNIDFEENIIKYIEDKNYENDKIKKGILKEFEEIINIYNQTKY